MATTRHVQRVVDSRGKTREVEVFEFQNPRKRKIEDKAGQTKLMPQPQAKVKSPALKKLRTEVQTLEMDLEAARRDVRNFGISGMEGRTKIEAQLAQLKSLGAEIPKNWERKMDKKKRNEEFRRRRQDLKAGIKTKKISDPNKSVQRAQAEKERRKEKKEGVFFDGQVGRYKDGVQYISRADIQRIRNSASRQKR